MADVGIPDDLFELIDKRFEISRENEGRWQVLTIAGYPATDIVLRHDPLTGARFVACPVRSRESRPGDFRWRAKAIRSDWVERIREDQQIPHLLVATTDQRQHPMLTEVLAGLIRNGIQDPTEIVRRLRSLQRWWEPPREMSDDAAVGLFGELYFLARWIDEEWPARVKSWDGPDRSLKDFNWSELALHVEVKTTQGMDFPLTHVVSGVSQLDVEPNHRLALFSLSARCDPSGGESLASLVGEIRTCLSGDPVADGDFVEKLGTVGYHPDLPDFRFVVNHEAACLYKVDDTFPRIVPKHFAGHGGLAGVDSRITVRSYSIRMEQLEEHRLDLQPPTPPERLDRMLR